MQTFSLDVEPKFRCGGSVGDVVAPFECGVLIWDLVAQLGMLL
jgi:hypothetical protein